MMYYTRLVLIGMSRKHFSGTSFGGKFTSSQLLFKDGVFKFDDAIVPEQYTLDSAVLDYETVAQVLNDAFYDEANKFYPLHLDHLLTFLLTLPSQAEPNSDAVIALLTNHFAVLSYTERVAVSEILDGLVARLSWAARTSLLSCLRPLIWKSEIEDVLEMNDVYYFDAVYDQHGNVKHVPYGPGAEHCLHFSNNYFKHAGCYRGSHVSVISIYYLDLCLISHS